MSITPKNLVRHELISLKVKIKESTNPSQVGIEGKVIDETFKTLKIETKKREKTIPKENTWPSASRNCLTMWPPLLETENPVSARQIQKR